MTNNAIPSFSAVYPFNVKLENHAFGQDVSLLYITNKINETSAFQKLKISVFQEGTGQYTFNKFDFTKPATAGAFTPSKTINSPSLAPVNSSFKPDASQYNLGVVVKHGVLEEQVALSFSDTLYTAIQASLPTGNDCVVQGPFISTSENTLTWYCALSKDINCTKQNTTWAPTSSPVQMVNISKTADSKLFGIGSDHNFYTCDLSSGTNWVKVATTGGWQAFSGIATADGCIWLIGLDHNLYYGGTIINSEYKLTPNCGNTAFLAGMADNSLLGLNISGDLLHMPFGATAWQTIDKTIPLKSISVGGNNEIYGIGTDDSTYVRSDLEGTWVKLTTIPDIIIYQQKKGVEQYGVNHINNTLVSSKVESAVSALFFELEGVSAAAGVGSRNTQIEFLFGNVSVGSNSEKFSFKRSISVDIINHQGSSYAPMHFGVVGENTLLNNGAPQDLTLYFQTNQNQALSFNENTIITFSFAAAEQNTELVTFGNSSILGSYAFSPDKNGVFSAISKRNGVITLGFKASSNAVSNRLSVETFKFSGIALNGSDGLAIIEVYVQNLPGFWDSTFQIAINKKGSTSSSQEQLELPQSNNNGRSGSNGSRIDFTTEGKDKNTNFNVSIEADNGLNLYGTAPNVAASAARGVPTSASEQTSGLPVRVRETDLIIPDGRLAINGGNNYPKPETGDANTHEKLNVTGDTFLDGHLGVSQDLGVGGDATLAGKTNLKGGMSVTDEANFKGGVSVSGDTSITGTTTLSGVTNINAQIELGNATTKGNYGTGSRIDFLSSAKAKNGIANASIEENFGLNLHGTATAPVKVRNTDLEVQEGRIKDQTGYVMPVGSVIAFAGKTAPEGWLMCDGLPIPSTCTDLITLMGTTTPNLCGRTVIGAGPHYVMNSDGSQPNLGYLGSLTVGEMKGDVQHTLTEAEMPAHNHRSRMLSSFSGPGTGYPGHSGSLDGDDINNTTSTTGGNQPHNNMQPYTALNYIIKY